ncbi:MAG: DUF1385 domain-containing protein [Ruminococcus sp.]|nr:DUF1385 domain-containing protein [Ruminococcus sp.]MBQ7008323.1 DUF1385 domain-containing protein [Ruminococcus sp.]
MSEKEKKEIKSKIGGQALIEGIMMLGVNKGAMACRLPDGTIDVEEWEERNGKNAPLYKRIPFVRGGFNFISSMAKGYKYLMKSADKQIPEEEKKDQTKAESAVMDLVMIVGMVIGVAVALGIFMFLPKILVGLIKPVEDMRILRSFLEGIVKIILFVGYMALTGLMKDIRRTYEYHGAEHKTIACHEARLPLTVENIRKQPRFHKRCGTSFIFIVLIVSILVMCVIPFTVTWKRIVAGLVLLPFVVGISYEFIRLAGNHDNAFTRILSAPGLALQKITTREPDDSQIEVAIAAMKPCIPDNLEEDVW